MKENHSSLKTLCHKRKGKEGQKTRSQTRKRKERKLSQPRRKKRKSRDTRREEMDMVGS